MKQGKIHRSAGLLVVLMMLLLSTQRGATKLARADHTLPSSTPVATVTQATAEATPAASPAPGPDAAEPNDTVQQARPIDAGGTLQKLTFWPAGDVDYYALLVKPSQLGLTLTVQTHLDYGLDTTLRLLRPDGTLIAENDDAHPTEQASQVALRLADEGYLIVEVRNVAISAPDFKTYQLETTLEGPGLSSTPTPPAETSLVAGDRYENNYDFAHAAPIGLGEPVVATFACPAGSPLDCGDNDFYAVPLKGGQCYLAETRDLDPALDTNLIVFGPGLDQAPPLAGNDDAAPGELRSAARFCLPPGIGSFMGFVLVGNAGNRTPPEPVQQRSYTLAVTVVAPPTPTPTPPLPVAPHGAAVAPPAGAQGALPPQADLVPSAPPALAQALPGVTVEAISLAHTATPTTRPLLAVPLAIRACYDRNQNGFCDVDEGIAGLTVYATSTGGRVLGQALTDRGGVAQLVVRVEEREQISVSVPYFAAQQTVAAREPRLNDVLVSTVAPLPALLP